MLDTTALKLVSDTASDIDALAAHTKASADPLRLNILRILGEGSFGVLELCELFEIKQSSMSHHLKILAKAGLVTTRREGNSIFYRRSLLNVAIGNSNSAWFDLTQVLFRTLDKIAPSEIITERLQGLYQERAKNSQEFFTKHASEFHEKQDLIASHEQYGETLEDLVATLNLQQTTTALEIGPGEGYLLSALSQRFQQVIGLDVSEAMLKKANLKVAEQDLENIELVHGDCLFALSQNVQADLVTCNMVLHHVPAPKEIFNHSAQLLKPGGCLLITDLCAHDQTWARESCGDLWLGFAPEDLTSWAKEAQLCEEQTQFLALRNGFQIQFRTFRRAVA
ncbi:metalloregulator ArsR/SmtB family transcription factor [uncultured Paraglaciecola sp.]|uniref:ArsR/SmtB family transcription factor n=1 Tax=uncultured Paraglaciecola sp. TaxID=1765024 RepID=UPI00260967B0|nr:metalloregulator ArsR/SmtB family transcription factor [uncultured Paraglaciecola sp.]